MKALKFVNVWLFLPIALGTHAMPGKFTPGKITNPVVCNADATQSYAVYVPVRGNSQPLPVIYMFDPHGDGALPLTKYRQLADVYGFILVGSNNSKNGNDWATTGNIWNNLYTDTQKKLKINGNRVYTCGFSGGAKVAGYIALEYSMVKSVIANSAALPDGIGAANYNFGFTGIAGTGDMNMTALAGFCKSLDNTTTRHRMLLFDGKHEWAPATTMQLAFEGLQLEAMQQGLMAKDDQLVARLAAQGRQKINALSNAGRWINAKQYCDIFYSYLNGLASDAAWFKQQANLIAAGKPYQAQQTQQDDLMNKEQQLEAGYMQQFRQGDEAYWAKTVGWLQKQAAANTAEGPMYQRVLAWLSLAF
ncbi:MAG TPA: hypothetical protein VHB48_12475, partial [Chitinophagaceae bacterium]|nr:hypothetical protein [Chitinophagaceae bacterium]